MKDVAEFLAYAVKLEEQAARCFDELADVMESHGNREVRDFFRQMAEFSRMHLGEAKARSGFQDLPVVVEGFESPEVTVYQAMDPLIAMEEALQYALEAERRGHAFYAQYMDHQDPEIRVMAKEFADEEAMHVFELEKWVERSKKIA